jgi:hypothetical protein
MRAIRLDLPGAEVPGFSTYFVYLRVKNSARVNVFRDFLVSRLRTGHSEAHFPVLRI